MEFIRSCCCLSLNYCESNIDRDSERDCMQPLLESSCVTASPWFRICHGVEADTTPRHCERVGDLCGSSESVSSHSIQFMQVQPSHTLIPLTDARAIFSCLRLQRELVVLRFSLNSFCKWINHPHLQRTMNTRRSCACCTVHRRNHHFELRVQWPLQRVVLWIKLKVLYHNSLRCKRAKKVFFSGSVSRAFSLTDDWVAFWFIFTFCGQYLICHYVVRLAFAYFAISIVKCLYIVPATIVAM